MSFSPSLGVGKNDILSCGDVRRKELKAKKKKNKRRPVGVPPLKQMF